MQANAKRNEGMARVFVANSRKLTQKKGGGSTSRLVRKLMFISVDGDDDVRCKLSAVMNGNNRGSHLLFCCVCVCAVSKQWKQQRTDLRRPTTRESAEKRKK